MDRVEDVTLAFDSHAGDYDRWFDSPEGHALFSSELSAIRMLMEGMDAPFLEVGVGSGRFAGALGIGFGIDPSRMLLQKARQRGIDAVEGVGERLPYQDCTFGGVFLLFTLCFVENPLMVISEAMRVLKQRGRLIIGFINRESTWGMYYGRKKTEGHPIYRHATFYTSEEVIAMLGKAHLSVSGTASTLQRAPSDNPREEPAYMGLRGRAGFICLRAMRNER